MTSTNTGEYVAIARNASPSITVTGVSAAGVSLQDWVYILTAIYTALQIALIIWKVANRNKDKS